MSEERDRLQAMLDDTRGTTWDLSKNDRKAIEWALDRIDETQHKTNALEAVLLFHSTPPWDWDKQDRWREIIGVEECTAVILCDFIRKVSGKAESEGGT